MKKPIITTDIPGCRETVDDGKTGFLCQPKDVASLVSTIEKFLSLSVEERHNMGLNGRKKAEEIFDVNKVIDIYHTITDKYC